MSQLTNVPQTLIKDQGDVVPTNTNLSKKKILKNKVGLAASKAAALRINLSIDGCGTSLGSSYFIAHVLHYPPPLARTAL
jgi:hypothetical protein